MISDPRIGKKINVKFSDDTVFYHEEGRVGPKEDGYPSFAFSPVPEATGYFIRIVGDGFYLNMFPPSDSHTYEVKIPFDVVEKSEVLKKDKAEPTS